MLLLLAACHSGAPTGNPTPAGYAFPPLSGRVVDAAHLLPANDASAIAAQSAALERSSGHQLVVVTVPALGNHSIEDYSNVLGNTWGIGRKGTNDGVLLVVAPKERKVRIEVGKGLERSLTDPEAATIIQRSILPQFKAGNFASGIHRGVDAIIAEIGPQQRKAA